MLDQDYRYQSKNVLSWYFLKNSSFLLEKKIFANDVCEVFGFKEKRKQKRRVFRLCYNNLILIPRQLLKLPLLCMSMGSRALNRQIEDQKNLNEKSFVWMFRIDLKKLRQKNYCDKNSLLIRAIQSHCGLLTRKRIKRPVTVALPYPPPLHQNEGKLQKKSKSKAFFMFFQQHYKRTNFSVFDDHI